MPMPIGEARPLPMALFSNISMLTSEARFYGLLAAELLKAKHVPQVPSPEN